MGEVSMTEMAGEALTAAAVETIARSGGLVAGRAGGHRPTLLRAPHDFADSSHRGRLCRPTFPAPPGRDRGVGRDNISDFTTNLIKEYLLEFTERFARTHLAAKHCRIFRVSKVRFNYLTQTWESGEYYLPTRDNDYVLLTNEELRAQIDNYFGSRLSRRPTEKERRAAEQATIAQFPQLIDYYIAIKEGDGDRAQSVSSARVSDAKSVLVDQLRRLLADLEAKTDFYKKDWTSYDESLERALLFKHYVENQDGYRLINRKGQPFSTEEEVHLYFGVMWCKTDAAAAMALSSLSVVSNANRLRGFRTQPPADGVTQPAIEPHVEVGTPEPSMAWTRPVGWKSTRPVRPQRPTRMERRTTSVRPAAGITSWPPTTSRVRPECSVSGSTGDGRWTAGARVEVIRDEHGVARVRAHAESDAYRGLGSCHAADRALQLLLMGVVVSGRGSELLQADDAMLELDRFFRRLNLVGEAEEEVAKLRSADRLLASAYCEGLNATLHERHPWELRLPRYRPEPWTIADSIALSCAMGYVQIAQHQADMERLLVQMVQGGVSREQLEELFPGMLDGLDVDLVREVRLGEGIVPKGVRWMSAVPGALASNNWAIARSGRRAATRSSPATRTWRSTGCRRCGTRRSSSSTIVLP